MNSKRNDGMNRRSFLIASTTAAGAALALGPNLFAEAGEVKRWAVGYVPLDGVRSGDEPFAPNVIPGKRIAAGDAAFRQNDARVRVLGIAGLSSDPASRRAHEVQAHFAARGENGERLLLPFTAWNAGRISKDTGNPVSFRVPLDDQDRIRLSIVAATPVASRTGDRSRRDIFGGAGTEIVNTSLPVTLSLRGGRGAVKLARGYYVITPLFEGQKEPHWSRLELRNGALHEQRGDSFTPVGFEHVVMSVDYDRRT
jgi:hypothetical protein